MGTESGNRTGTGNGYRKAQYWLRWLINRKYAQRIREVEHGVFTPLVLSATSGRALKLQLSVRDWWMDFPGRRKTNILSSRVDSLLSLLCDPPLCYPMHSWKQILSPPPSPQTKHCTSYLRRMCFLGYAVKSAILFFFCSTIFLFPMSGAAEQGGLSAPSPQNKRSSIII